MLIVVYGSGEMPQMLSLCSHVIVDDHLHVEAVVSLLSQSLLLALISCGLYLSDYLLLDELDAFPGPYDLLYCFVMLFHVGVDGCLI